MNTRRLLSALATVLLTSALPLSGCSAEAEQQPPLEIGAAFTTLKSVKIYNQDGTPVSVLDAENPVGDLPLHPGDYYLDMEDHYGNGVFTDDGTMVFVPEVSGAELDLTPHRLFKGGRPLPRIIVKPAEETNRPSSANDSAELGQTSQAVHTFGGNEYWMRSRVVWEAARAMVGPGAAGRHHWPLETVNSRHRYASEDLGAWSAVHRAYDTFHSCRHDSDAWNNYSPCRLNFGADNAYQYEVQNGWHKGGQCKSFSNLLIYRSGVHHGPNWSLRMLPTDRRISDLRGAVRARQGNLQAGDVLRMPRGHSAIVVRVIDSNRAVVIDSNWMGGNGWENVATHVMSFSGSGVSNLGNYYRLNCVYDGSC